ncbi:peptidyl-tRNA hydrolase (plasmid) [Rossellomorea sp. AcN35-11]|nr:hypothetical protein [Rossellomorea aquimaris]WJV31919.1 peptidyl-tRNA hydrolase [Rossellomorea sp. AcN35-11]
MRHQNEQEFIEWFDSSQVQVVLQAKESMLKRLINEGWEQTSDEGRTEIPTNSLTAVACKPILKSEVPKHIKRLQLLKIYNHLT